MNLKIFINHGEQIVYFFVNLVSIDQLERWDWERWLLGTSCTNDMTIFTSALYIFYAKCLRVCNSLVMISFLTVFFKFFLCCTDNQQVKYLTPIKIRPPLIFGQGCPKIRRSEKVQHHFGCPKIKWSEIVSKPL